MSRKHSNFTRDILPDPKFGSEMITRFVNMVMHSGKKSVAERIVYGAMDTIEDKNKSATPVELVEAALENVSKMPMASNNISLIQFIISSRLCSPDI